MKTYFFWTVFLTTGYLFGQEFHFRQAPPFPDGDVRQVNIIFQSTDQMIWLGTDKGIYSFDGRKYLHKLRPDKQIQKVTAIGENPMGQIWAGYEDGYLHAVSQQGSIEVIPTDSIRNTAISKILFQPNGEIFIATYGKGIWLVKGNKMIRLQYQSLASIEDVYDALIDLQGRLWLATDNGIWIYQKNPTEISVHLNREKGLPDEIVTQLELENNGDVWIGLYDHGLARYLIARDTVMSLMSLQPSSGNVIGLVKGRLGDILIGAEKALATYSISGKGHVMELPPECKDRLQGLLFDISGNLWLASGNKIFIANTQFEYVQPAITGIQAISIADDKLWIGSEYGLYGMDLVDHQLKPYLEKEKMNILSMYSDPSGLLWIGTFGQGLYIFDPENNRSLHLTEKDNLSNNSILNIDGRDKTVWLASLGGITEINWKEDPMTNPLEIVGFLDKFNFPPGYVYDVFAGKDGRTWFGTDGKSLYCLDHNQLRPFTIQVKGTDLTEDDTKTIYSITADAGQNVWISASKGQILQLDPSGNIIEQMETSQGIINTLITSGNGEILMIGEGAIQIKHPDGEMYLYNESSGLTSFSPNINATAKDIDGSLWIANTDRLLHYIPVKEDIRQHVQIHLESVSPGSLFGDGLIRLEPDSNFLDIRFTGLWYQNPADVQYRYMLEGHDKDWIYTREGRAVYSRLSSGTYTFLVAGSHTEDFSGTIPMQKEVIVLPPFYLKWWFVLGAFLLVSWIIYAYVKARIKRINRLHQLEKEKTMLRLHAIQAQVNPHFLFNSFNTLSSIIEENQKAAVDYVDQFSGFFRGVLMHRDAALIQIEEEMDIVRNYTYILQKRYGDNLNIIEEIANTAGWIAPLSIQLLVENAIKHNIVSTEKPLTVFITIDDQWVSVSNPVQPKMQISTESTGFGLSSLIARYQYLTGIKIEIRKEQNTFAVRIPVIQSEKPV